MSLQSTWDSSFAALQKIGKALMLPVSVLPVAGILLGVGSSIADAENLAPLLFPTLKRNSPPFSSTNLPPPNKAIG